jgi:hypothetical protein
MLVHGIVYMASILLAKQNFVFSSDKSSEPNQCGHCRAAVQCGSIFLSRREVDTEGA